jgi:NitT/TauT family transport system substrate-binding protein
MNTKHFPLGLQRKTFLAGLAAAAVVGPRRALADGSDLNVGFIPFDPDAVAVYARDRGYFKAAGIEPKLVPVQSPGIVAAGLLSGSLQFGTMGIGTLAAARLRGFPLLLVAPSAAITDASRDDGIFVTANSPINTAADLNGKTVGIFGLRNMQHAVFLQWIEQHGGDSSSVKFIETPLPQAVGALEAGRVDAIFLAEPYISMSQARLRVIGHYWEALARPALSLGYCATESWLAKNGSEAAKFNQAVCKAAVWANGHHAETAPIVASLTKMDPEVAQHMVRSSYGTTISAALLQPGIDAMVKHHFLEKSIDANELIWRADSKPA